MKSASRHARRASDGGSRENTGSGTGRPRGGSLASGFVGSPRSARDGSLTEGAESSSSCHERATPVGAVHELLRTYARRAADGELEA